MDANHPRALIAEDEPLLALALQAELARLWPALQVLAVVGDGASAVQQALALQPDVLFLDIRMPGMSGLEAATELAEQWPEPNPGTAPFPRLVFVTAYEDYALQAFDVHAVDYLLKPVQTPRLQKTVDKLQQNLAQSARSAPDSGAQALHTALDQLRGLLHQGLQDPSAPVAPAPARLHTISASVGSTIHMVPVDEVLYFEAADKYVRVVTAQREYLIRTPIKELLPQLDADVFWQIHRSTIVQAKHIDQVTRDDSSGKIQLQLKGRSEALAISRLHAARFKAM